MPSTSSGDAWHDYRPSPDGLPQYLSPRQPPGRHRIDRRAMVLECGAIEKPSEPLLRPCPSAFALSAGASPVLVVVNEPKGDTHHRFVYGDQQKPLSGCFARNSPAPVRAVRRAFRSRACKWGDPISVGAARTLALGAAPSKPLETTGERGANGASVRRVAPRTDLSNARS
jgi:hypothetical protein